MTSTIAMRAKIFQLLVADDVIYTGTIASLCFERACPRVTGSRTSSFAYAAEWYNKWARFFDESDDDSAGYNGEELKGLTNMGWLRTAYMLR